MSYTKLAAAVLVASLGAGCSEPASAPTSHTEANSPPSAVEPRVKTADHAASAEAAAASPGKPGAPATVEFAVPVLPQLSLPIPIQVTVRPTATVDRLEVQIGSSDGMTLSRSAKPIATGPRTVGETLTESVMVTPVTEGVHYLRVTVVTRLGAQELATVKVYPVQVGAVQQKSEGTVKTTPEGERIIEMPAQESGG